MKLTLSILLGLAVIAIGYWWLFVATPTTNEQVPTDAAGDTTSAEPDTVRPSNDYVGLSVREAETVAEANGVPFRVVERDGEQLMVTEDWRPGRINAVVEDGVVVSYTVEGEGMATSTPPAEDGAAGEGSATATEETASGEHDVIIGMTQAEAEAYAEANEVEFRIGSIDGEPRALTMDYRPGRITASLEDDVVVSYTVE